MEGSPVITRHGPGAVPGQEQEKPKVPPTPRKMPNAPELLTGIAAKHTRQPPGMAPLQATGLPSVADLKTAPMNMHYWPIPVNGAPGGKMPAVRDDVGRAPVEATAPVHQKKSERSAYAQMPPVSVYRSADSRYMPYQRTERNGKSGLECDYKSYLDVLTDHVEESAVPIYTVPGSPERRTKTAPPQGSAIPKTSLHESSLNDAKRPKSDPAPQYMRLEGRSLDQRRPYQSLDDIKCRNFTYKNNGNGVEFEFAVPAFNRDIKAIKIIASIKMENGRADKIAIFDIGELEKSIPRDVPAHFFSKAVSLESVYNSLKSCGVTHVRYEKPWPWLKASVVALGEQHHRRTKNGIEFPLNKLEGATPIRSDRRAVESSTGCLFEAEGIDDEAAEVRARLPKRAAQSIDHEAMWE